MIKWESAPRGLTPLAPLGHLDGLMVHRCPFFLLIQTAVNHRNDHLCCSRGTQRTSSIWRTLQVLPLEIYSSTIHGGNRKYRAGQYRAGQSVQSIHTRANASSWRDVVLLLCFLFRSLRQGHALAHRQRVQHGFITILSWVNHLQYCHSSCSSRLLWSVLHCTACTGCTVLYCTIPYCTVCKLALT